MVHPDLKRGASAHLHGMSVSDPIVPGPSAAPSLKLEPRRTALEYEAILQNAWVGILFTRGRRVLHCNERFASMFGYAPDELHNEHGSVFFAGRESYEDLGRIAEPRLTAGETLDLEWRLRRKDGSEFWCRLLGKAISPADHTQGTIWIAEDVTDRKQAQEALRQILLEQDLLLNHATIGIAFVRDRLIRRVNPRMEEIFGYTQGEMDGSSTRVIYASDEDYRALGNAVYAPGRQDPLFQSELQFRRKDGSLFWGKVIGNMVEPGNPQRGWIWVLEDITQRRHAEEILFAARDELEQRVRERTAELFEANQKLKSQIAERKLAEERARHLADHDVLTGLPNRRLLRDRLAQALALAHRHHKSVGVMFIDLDHFKSINDNLGHHVGDKLLIAVASRLTSVLREGDTVARVGGDEFVIALPELGKDRDAAVVARKILELLSHPIEIERHELTISPSIGISVSPGDGNDTDTLLRHADAAMYEAKAAGRNNFQFYTLAAQEAASERLTLEAELRRALDSSEMELQFQPRVDLASGLLRGFEALVRWRHPREGLLGTERFLPLAHESGLIVPLGEWVIGAACHAAATWQAGEGPRRPVAVNLSARESASPRLPQVVKDALTASGLESGCLEFELEDDTLDQGSEMASRLAHLKEVGVRLSAERVGGHAASLLALCRLKIDRMKIDLRAFPDVATDPDQATVVTGLLNLARSLGVEASAAGIETPAQLAFLRRHGCREGQGYLIGHPMPVAKITPLLQPGARLQF